MNVYFRNIAAVTTISLLESVWATAVLGWYLSHFPKPSLLTPEVFAEWRFLLKPKWDLELYHFFIFTSCVAQFILVAHWRRRLEDKDLWTRLRTFLSAETASSLILFGLALKSFAFPQPQQDHQVFAIYIFASLLYKMPWLYWLKRSGASV